MTSVTNIRLRVLPRFPTGITGTNGITVVREGSGLVVKPDFGQLAEISNVPDSDETLFIAWNKETGEYNTISFQATFDNSGNSRGYATKLAAEVATISASVHGIELYGRDVVGDGLGGLYIDSDNGSSETFISGDGRAWYLAPDIRASRLTGAPDIRNFLDTPSYVATRTAAKALDTTKETTLILTEAGREGIFNWRAGNYSAQITADTLEGIYIKANAIASSAGAWVRVQGYRVDLRVFGALGDGTTDDTAAVNAALAAGVALTGAGKIYGVTGKISLPAGASLWDATFKQLAPGASLSVITLEGNNVDNLDLRRVKVNRNGDGTNGGLLNASGTNGALNTAYGMKFMAGTGHHFEDLEVFGDDSGTGILFQLMGKSSKIIRPYVRNMAWARTAATDDQIQGVWFDQCRDIAVEHPRGINMTGTLNGVASKRFTRAIVQGGCTNFSLLDPYAEASDQGIDLSGGPNTNTDCRVVRPVARDIYTWGVKLANTARRCVISEGKAEGCGVGFVASGNGALAAGGRL
jgi:hypothetical protein